MSYQECLTLIAYLNFLTMSNVKQDKQDPVKDDAPLKPHRPERIGRPANRPPRVKLAELLAQDLGYAEHCEAVKARNLKPHRPERIGRPTNRPPRVKLTELLAGAPEDNESGEWDTGPSSGKEIW